MQLKNNSQLQGGRYKIIDILGQGGFGITYLAIQSGLERKVAIKEFFMKELCERDESTSHVTPGTEGSRDTVNRFREKFLKEARNIASLDHPNIVRIIDVFEENGTAYYVMEYIEGESLYEIVKRGGALPETAAVNYIRQVAQALSYIHAKSINHLDIKPANIMVRKSDSTAVLIDFGLSKQYDSTGGQTSSTPVGISEGYAPLEQYQAGGVSIFTPQTDIYSLGATLYFLATGKVPPSASEVLNNGIPALPSHISASTKTAINQVMQFRKKDRPQSVDAFLNLLVGTGAPYSTQTTDLENKATRTIGEVNSAKRTNLEKVFLGLFFCGVAIVVLGGAFLLFGGHGTTDLPVEPIVIEEEEIIELEPEIVQTVSESTGKRNGHGYVDLGLSVKWATCNVGATKPEEYGNYYSWGETSKSSYGWDTYFDTTDGGKSFNKYNSGYKDVLDPEDDAANVHWESSWRIPTKEEVDELLNNCTYEWIVLNGINGNKFTSKKNGNSIFLPAAGMKTYNGQHASNEMSSGYYWTSNMWEYSNKAKAISFYDAFCTTYIYDRYYGLSIRPVIE